MTSDRAPLDAFEFVRAHTRVDLVPFVPELRLHQADDAFRLWQTTERDLERDGIALPYWAFAWAGGTALARYVLDHPELVHGCRVLDFATGSGLVAIAAARAGAVEVFANDIDPIALAAAELNAALNGVSVTTLHADLLTMPAPSVLERVEVVLAGDVAYERASPTRRSPSFAAGRREEPLSWSAIQAVPTCRPTSKRSRAMPCPRLPPSRRPSRLGRPCTALGPDDSLRTLRGDRGESMIQPILTRTGRKRR